MLPLGTANRFARTLKFPLDLSQAIDVITDGKIADVDLITINGDYFANTANIGLSAIVAQTISNTIKKRFGKVVYLLSGMKSFVKHKAFTCKLTIDNKVMELTALEILTDNGNYQGGFKVSPQANIDNKSISLTVVKCTNKWELLKVGFGTIYFHHTDTRHLFEITAQNIKIETTPKQYVDIDGEITTQTPIDIAVVSEALKIMVSQSFKDDD